MHRTAKNCISVLYASSRIGGEFNPVNRTRLLETILTTIFDEYEIPTYHDKKPDVKDCSFVLGYFCELLILEGKYEFTETFFKDKLKEFCASNFITLDIEYLLSVLIDNAILTKDLNYDHLFFRNSYWVFYFIGQRMNMDSGFRQTMFENKKYVDYPEIIEFYTGIDRNKVEALEILIKDLDETVKTVSKKVNISDQLNPYESIEWLPDIETLKKEQEIISQNILSSGLPDEIKDKYDDKQYDQLRPYNQIINSVIREYSFLSLMRQVSACSRALRNSDFVNPRIKVDLLDKITIGWNEINKLLIALSPFLADRGSVAFEGAQFILDDEDFEINDPIEKRKAVLLAVPTNVVKFFKDDLFSSKMGPLLIDKARNAENSLIKHELMLLIIAERPDNWNKIIDEYIVSLDKNSYFLSDVLHTLNFNIDFKSTETQERRLLSILSKKCTAKHLYNKRNPDMGLINKIK